MGPSQEPRRARPPRRSLRAAALLGALLVTILATVPGAAAARERAAGSGELAVVAQSAAVEPGDPFALRLRVTGAPATAQLQVRVHDRTATRSSFQSTLTGKGFAGVLRTITAATTADASGSTPITIATRSATAGPDDGLLIGPGVYPVEVGLVDGRDTLDSITTYLVVLRPSDQGPSLGVGVVVALGQPDRPAHGPDGMVRADAGGDATAAIAAALVAHPTVPATIAAYPERLAAVTSSTGQAALRAAAGAGRSVAPGPLVPVDEAAWLANGLGDDLASEVDAARDDLTAALAAPSTHTWVSDHPLDSKAAGWIESRGFSTIALPDDAVSELDSRRFNTTLAQPFALEGLSGVRAIALDHALAAHVGETGDPVLDAHHLLADLAILDLDRPSAQRAIALALPATTPAALVDTLLSGLATTRTLRAATLDDLAATTPVAGSRGEVDGTGSPLTRSLVPQAPAQLGDLPTALHEARDDVVTYRSTLLDADASRAATLDSDALRAADRHLGDEDRRTLLASVRNRIAADLAKVTAPSRQTITFTARDGTVSLALRNETGHAVRVLLHLVGPRLELPGHEDGVLPLILPAGGGTTSVQLDVRARSSGDASLDVDVVTPDGRTVITQAHVTVRSTALSGVGVILSVGAIAFLSVWWGRHALATRRARRRTPRHAIRPSGSGG